MPLPDGNWEWEKGNLLSVDYIMQNYENWSDDDERGMVFEATWEYPEFLHKKHNSFPLMPESRTVTDDLLSDYSKLCYKTLRGKEKYSDKKLVTTFLPKHKYVCHYMNMKEYLRQGMVLKKVHRCLSFTQSRFIEPFIKICTEKRRQAKTTFKKSLYKAPFINYVTLQGEGGVGKSVMFCDEGEGGVNGNVTSHSNFWPKMPTSFQKAQKLLTMSPKTTISLS